MADLEVSISGAPVGAARPRFRRATGTTYKLKKHAGWESYATDVFLGEWEARWGTAVRARPPIDEPTVVRIEMHHARPKRLRRRADPRCALPAIRKPDVDNVAKLVLDALVKAGVLRDDTVVVELVARRWYLPIDERGRDVGGERVDVSVALWGAQ